MIAKERVCDEKTKAFCAGTGSGAEGKRQLSRCVPLLWLPDIHHTSFAGQSAFPE